MRFALVLAAVCACSSPAGRGDLAHPGPSHSTKPHSTPRLVVLLVIDQWPEWSFEQKRAELSGGFARVLAEGEWHVGKHATVATLTSPGHALLGTGKYSSESGILANVWWHRDVAKQMSSVEDVDGKPTNQWLLARGLGDVVTQTGAGKAVAVSLKDRAAILPLGHAGLPVWYDPKQVAWTTLAAPPPWLAEWNRSHPVADRLHEVWEPLDAALLAKLSGVADDQPGEVGEKHFGPTFPHDPQTTPKPADAIFAMPLGAELVFDTATAAIAGEQLGRDEHPDLLVISISPHDYVGHGWGHESWEAWDLTLRLDRRLRQFVDDLDRDIGRDRWAMILTSDHGASPLPERVGGGRLTHDQIKIAANNAASAVLGPGEWIDNAHYPYLYWSPAALAQPPKELASATKRVLNALQSIPGIERVGRVGDFLGRCDERTGTDHDLCAAFAPGRSGDLFYLPARGWILQDPDEPLASSHGSHHDYDQQVPLIIVPPGHKLHAAQTAPLPGSIDMRTIAPTLSSWLGVPAP